MTDEQDDQIHGMGHNQPPVSLDDLPQIAGEFGVPAVAKAIPSYSEKEYRDLHVKISKIAENAAKWLDLGKIEDLETSALASDQIAQLRAMKTQIANAQKAAKKIWADKADEAFKKFSILLISADKGIKKMLDIQTDFMKREADRKEAEALEQKRIADAEAERVAAERARAEQANDLMGMAAADEAEKEVAKMAKSASKAMSSAKKVSVGSASGAGRGTSLRSVKVPVIENYLLTRMHYGDHEKVREVIEQLVAAEVRAATFDPKIHSIPGVRVDIEEKAQ